MTAVCVVCACRRGGVGEDTVCRLATTFFLVERKERRRGKIFESNIVRDLHLRFPYVVILSYPACVCIAPISSTLVPLSPQ